MTNDPMHECGPETVKPLGNGDWECTCGARDTVLPSPPSSQRLARWMEDNRGAIDAERQRRSYTADMSVNDFVMFLLTSGLQWAIDEDDFDIDMHEGRLRRARWRTGRPY